MRRSGFTLIELLVAMALIVFIMSILANAFAIASKTFTDLKAAGDMAEKLRAAANQIRKDLGANHFEGNKRLSDSDFWKKGPPREGFFRIWQAAQATDEGADVDTLHSYRADGSADNRLHFAVRLPGTRREDFLAAYLSGDPAGLATSKLLESADNRFQDSTNMFNSQWGEIAYFLKPLADASGSALKVGGSTPLYGLYRRQKVAVPSGDQFPTFSTADTTGAYIDVSTGLDPGGTTPKYSFNSSEDLAIPDRRMDALKTGILGTYPRREDEDTSGTYTTADLLLPDVVSFDVRVLVAFVDAGGAEVSRTNEFVDLFDSSLTPYKTNPNYTGLFDTWAKTDRRGGKYATADTPPFGKDSIPMWRKGSTPPHQYISVRGIQITVRVWDLKTETSRQVTIVQDL